MSGLEIAGVVLGTLPLLVNSAVSVKNGLEKTKAWWQFETTFTSFIAQLREEEISYRQVFKRLLYPTEIPDDELWHLLDDPGSHLGSLSTIREALETRLDPNERSWFEEQLEGLCQTVQSLHNLLPQEQTLNTDVDLLEKELYRLNLSFRSKKSELLDQLTKTNHRLHLFLDRDQKIHRPVLRVFSSFPFEKLHDRAIELHRDISSCHKCSCAAAHSVGLSVKPMRPREKRGSDQPNLDTLLSDDRQKAIFGVELLEDQIYGNPSNEPLKLAGVEAYSNRVDRLAAQIRNTQQCKQIAKGNNDKRVSALAVSSFTTSSHPVQPPLSFSKSSFGKRTHELFSSVGAKTKRVYPTQLSDDMDDRRVSLKTQNGDISSGTEPSHGNNISDSGTSPNGDECRVVDGVCELMERISFSSQGDGRHHYFRLGRDAKAVLRHQIPEDPAAAQPEARRLSVVVSTVASRFERLEIGLRLSLNLIALATTPWLPNTLDGETALVLGHFAKRPLQNLSGPYFPYCASADSPGANSSSPTAWKARSCLLWLGISLLELLYGTRLDEQPSWKDMLDECGGKPNATTPFYSAFLWIKRSKGDLEKYFGPDDGNHLFEGIRKCICFDFEHGQDPENGDSKLAEAVFREVIEPIQRCCPEQLID